MGLSEEAAAALRRLRAASAGRGRQRSPAPGSLAVAGRPRGETVLLVGDPVPVDELADALAGRTIDLVARAADLARARELIERVAPDVALVEGRLVAEQLGDGDLSLLGETPVVVCPPQASRASRAAAEREVLEAALALAQAFGSARAVPGT